MKYLFCFISLLFVMQLSAQVIPQASQNADLSAWDVEMTDNDFQNYLNAAIKMIEQIGSGMLYPSEETSFFIDANYDGKIDLMQMGMVMGVVFYEFFPGTDDGFGKSSLINGRLYKVSEPDGINPLELEVILNPCCGGNYFAHYKYEPVETDSGLVYTEKDVIYFFDFYEQLETDIIDNAGKQCEIKIDSAKMLVNPEYDILPDYADGEVIAAIFPTGVKGRVVFERELISGEHWVLMLTDPGENNYLNAATYLPFTAREQILGWLRADEIKIY